MDVSTPSPLILVDDFSDVPQGEAEFRERRVFWRLVCVVRVIVNFSSVCGVEGCGIGPWIKYPKV